MSNTSAVRQAADSSSGDCERTGQRHRLLLSWTLTCFLRYTTDVIRYTVTSSITQATVGYTTVLFLFFYPFSTHLFLRLSSCMTAVLRQHYYYYYYGSRGHLRRTTNAQARAHTHSLAHTRIHTRTRQTHLCLTCFGDFGSPGSGTVASRRSKHGGRAVWQRVRVVYKVSPWAPIGLREVWSTPQTLGHRAASQSFVSWSGCLPVERRRSEVKEASFGTLVGRFNGMRDIGAIQFWGRISNSEFDFKGNTNSCFYHWMNKQFSEENKLSRALSEAIKVAGSAKYELS